MVKKKYYVKKLLKKLQMKRPEHLFLNHVKKH